MNTKILALITARKGSKRLPKKNLKKIGKKTLVELAILSAQNIKEIKNILVSTDDKKVFEISKKAGALVPWLRPKKLARDDTSSEDVALHALGWYEKSIGKVDGLLLLQPTTPFRKRSTIIDAINLFKKEPSKQVVSVSKNKKMIANGAIYLTSPEKLRKFKTFTYIDFIPLAINSKKESIDINTVQDLNLARSYL